jgi:putative phosphoribosyl transferase
MDIQINNLAGILEVPGEARGLVLFSHGSGSSRFSPRNTFVAEILQKKGLATLLIDLLTEEEDAIYETRFDIDLLTKRLLTVIEWLQKNPATEALPIGLFGSSTGGASALKAAATPHSPVKAVVSRGGRPDLAMASLAQVKAPTLLIVGELDREVLLLNQEAFRKLSSIKEMTIIPGATHLFEEPGCLAEVAAVASSWFIKHLNFNVKL